MPPDEIDALRSRWETERTPQLSLHLAEAYRRAGRREEAVEVLTEALRTHPEHVAAQVAMGRYRLDLDQPGEAVRMLEAVVSKDPTHLVANKLLVEGYLRLEETKKARDRLDLYALLNTTDPDIEDLERRVASAPRVPPPATAEPVAPAVVAPPEIEPEEVAAGEDGPAPGLALPVAAPVEPPPAEPPAPVAPPRMAVPSEGDPFDDIWKELGEEEYQRTLSAEGIFGAGAVAAPAPPPAAAPESPAPAVGVPRPEGEATMVLGRLYRQQGHLAEAERIFEAVLERQPGHPQALLALEEVRASRSGPLTAAELLAGEEFSGPAAGVDRKRTLLRRYLDRLRAAK